MIGLPSGPLDAHAIEGWHEFYLMAGTAAVTLVGLLFVALSFHLDALLHDHHAHLLAAARLAFMNFIFVLMLSLFFLVPANSPFMVSIASLVLASVSLGMIVVSSMHGRRKGAVPEHEKFLGRRYAMSGAFMGVSIMTSVSMLVEPKLSQLYQFVPVVCAMLANAAGMSWDLLVQVGRIRRKSEAGDK